VPTLNVADYGSHSPRIDAHPVVGLSLSPSRTLLSTAFDDTELERLGLGRPRWDWVRQGCSSALHVGRCSGYGFAGKARRRRP
jgi:hypothetical protein